MEYLWNYKEHSIKAIYGDIRFGPVPIYLDGRSYGHATFAKGLVPKLEYDITLEEKTLKLIFTGGKLDLLEDGISLTDGTVYDLSPLKTPVRIVFYILLLVLPALVLALNAHLIVKIASVTLVLCGGILVTLFSLGPAASARKKLLLCIGITALCYLVCAMMWLGIMLTGM